MQDESNAEAVSSQDNTVEFRCPHCKSTVNVNEHLLGSVVDCPNPDCGQSFLAEPPRGQPVMKGESERRDEPDDAKHQVTTDEEVLKQVHPSMWRRHPFRFVGLWLLLLVGAVCLVGAYVLGRSWFGLEAGMLGTVGLVFVGVGGVLLLVWWLSVKFITLTVTNKRTIYRQGIVSRDINEIRHNDVRNLQVEQGAFERIMSIGDIGISSAGQEDIEIEAHDIPHPDKIADLVRELQ